MNLKNLPEDPQILHRMVLDFAGQITSLSEQVTSLSQKNNLLTEQIASMQDELANLRDKLAILRAKEFGSSSEKIKRQIDEIELRIEAKEEELSE